MKKYRVLISTTSICVSFLVIVGCITAVGCSKGKKEWINRRLWEDTDLDPRDIYFIQVGSNCGTDDCAIYGDPIWKDCRENHWSGVVIEPNPYVFGDLIKNYAWNPKVRAFQIAIADRDDLYDFFIPAYNKKAEVGSLSQKHLKKHKIVNDIKVSVLALKLESLWNMVLPQKVDILHVDTEGYDHIILLSTDFNKLNPKPKYILYEHGHMAKKEQDEVLKHLEKFSYTKKKSIGIDTMAELKK